MNELKITLYCNADGCGTETTTAGHYSPGTTNFSFDYPRGWGRLTKGVNGHRALYHVPALCPEHAAKAVHG